GGAGGGAPPAGGGAKTRLTVPRRVWDAVRTQRAAQLARLSDEARVRVRVDAEASDIVVLQLSAAPNAGGTPGRLCPARKALKALLKETEKELKKAQQRSAPGGGGGGAAAPYAMGGGGGGEEEEGERQCPICLGDIEQRKTLEHCRHSFCAACIARALQVKTACPVCGRFYGRLVGNQPHDGRMLVSRDAALPLPGYERYGTIVIQYVFPPGVQGVRARGRKWG
ncbi:probable E3 ubiquitin-protein ligase DTX3, partial [Phasianus colchicus]|uniref:probable E3 ubiquitin-protein ligase DTX3 n=1 Tax=Phasianus colchicus TaxID=9054 RepID=UPI00129E14B1